MRLRFWGTRGSIPVALTSADVRDKLARALFAASGRTFASFEEAHAFASSELDFSLTHTFGGHTPCVELELPGGEYFVCDMGSGARPFGQHVLAKQARRPATVNVFMSHVHWDHIMGFPFFGPAYVPGTTIRIHGCHDVLEHAFRLQQSPPCFPVEFDQLGAKVEFVQLTPDKPHAVGGLTVTPHLQLHGGDSYGYRFEHGGKAVVYSTDSEHKLENRTEAEAFARFFRDADVVVFDAMYALAEAISVKADWGHSSNIVGVELCQMARAKHLVLFHHEPANNDATLEGLLREARRFEELTRGDHTLKVSAAYDGLEIDANTLRGLRALAVVLLLALALFVVASPFAQPLRNAVFDTYQRVFPLPREAAHVAVVLIDENSIVRYGQWPWPRTRMAELLEAIARQRPAAIGLDLFFPEPDRFSPDMLARELPSLPPPVARTLAAMPSNDARFAEAIRGNPVVLGISAEAQPDPRFMTAPRSAPVRLGEGAADEIPQRSGQIGNLALLDAAAAGRGAMNSGPQGQVVRVVPLVLNVQGTIVPSLGVETLRVAADGGLSLKRVAGGLLRLSFDQVDVRLQDDGHTWLRYSHYDPASSVPAAGVMAGDVAPDTFRDKLVLVGISGLGVQDFKTTPLGEFIPGVHVHAQVIENLLANVSLVRPAWAPWAEALLLVACGVVLVAFVPRLSALRGINLALALVVLLFAVGAIAFLRFEVLIDPLWPSIGVAAVFGSVVVGTLSETERQRRVLREDAARMTGEVDAARRIQMGLLPDPHEAVGDQSRFDLAAMLEPARTVGGDFYDCFLVDARHLFLVVADVSGKGLPAALFMAAAKSHLKSAALRGGSVGEVLTRAQREIMRENPEQLFVTAFAASLDVETGMVEFANAGHEPPFTRTTHGPPERLTGAGGPPLCVVEDFDYPASRRQLQPGEWLVVVTDGATEAMNPKREFFGVERLRTALSWLPIEARPSQIVDKVREELVRFCDGAEAADDVTLMALRWDG